MNLDNQTREDLLVTALEGGSIYWYLLLDLEMYLDYRTLNEPIAIRIFTAIEKGEKIPVFDNENPDEQLGILSMESIKRGEKTMKEKAPEHWENIEDDIWDAETADVWFQFVIMNEIVFG
jgi:hypothetical protein